MSSQSSSISSPNHHKAIISPQTHLNPITKIVKKNQVGFSKQKKKEGNLAFILTMMMIIKEQAREQFA